MTGGDRGTWVSDLLGRWHGWSLVAPRPGTPRRTAPTQSIGATGIAIPTTVPPGTLPKLRYGHTYALRMRQVLLDGTSLPLSTASPTDSTETFARTEPVLPPTVLPTTSDLGPGASVGRLVVRTDATGAAIGDTRWIVPPSVAVDTAEKHGLFDRPDGALDPDALALIAAHEGDLWFSHPPAGPMPAKVDVVGAAAWAQAPPITFLPDPMARSAVFTVTSGAQAIGVADGATLEASFAVAGGTWPQSVAPIALAVTATDASVGGWPTTHGIGG